MSSLVFGANVVGNYIDEKQITNMVATISPGTANKVVVTAWLDTPFSVDPYYSATYTSSTSKASWSISIPANTHPASTDSPKIVISVDFFIGAELQANINSIKFRTPRLARSTNLLPSGGFVDEALTHRLSWVFQHDRALFDPTIAQKSATVTIAWPTGAVTTTQTREISGATNYTDFSPGDLPTDTAVTVTVRVTSTYNGGENGATSTLYFTTNDGSPTVDIIAPKAATIDGSIINRFEWVYTISTGTAQTRYTLQYSEDNGSTWEEFADEESADTYYDAPAYSITSGGKLWRVRGCNTDGDASDWSAPAAIVVRAAPLPPEISTVTATTRPTITWQSAEQQAYQVLASSGYDSGPVYGTAKLHRIPDFLPPGEYTLSVRVQNAFGLWSGWATAGITVINTPGALALSTNRANNGVSLTCAGDGFAQYLYYRNGVLIADTSTPSFTDFESNGKNTYQVRGVNGDNYTLSPIVVEIATPVAAVISAADSVDWVPLNYRRGGYATHDYSETQEVSYQHYSGGSLPVVEVGEAVTAVHDFAFSVDADTALKLRAMRAKRVVYKDLCGVLAVGIFNDYKQSRGAYRPSTGAFDLDVSFTVTEIRR